MTEELVSVDETAEEEDLVAKAAKRISKAAMKKLRLSTDFVHILREFEDLWSTGQFSVEFDRTGPTKDSAGNDVQLGWLKPPEFEGNLVDHEYIAERFGGGSYKVQVRGPQPDAKGGMTTQRVVLVKSGVFRIAGEPKSPELEACLLYTSPSPRDRS